MRKETKRTVEVVHTELVFPGDTNHYGLYLEVGHLP